jgi:hypothetical protein
MSVNTQQQPPLKTVAKLTNQLSVRLASTPQVPDGNPPTDAVITWVTFDEVQQKLVKALTTLTKNPQAVDEPPASRFSDHGMLVMCVRSIRMFMPWVRTIYIACADYHTDHVLKLFKTGSGLEIAPHSTFIPKAYLPTANSHAIEMHIGDIPGISNQFLYLNDDFFLLRPTPRKFFFRNERPVHYVGGWIERDPYVYRSEHARAWSNNIRLINKVFDNDRDVWPYPQHTPMAVDKKSFGKMLKSLQTPAIDKTASSPLRSGTDLHTLGLYVIWASLSKLSYIVTIGPSHHKYNGIDADTHVPSLLYGLEKIDTRAYTTAFNDEGMTLRQGKHLKELLGIIFPVASVHEL